MRDMSLARLFFVFGAVFLVVGAALVLYSAKPEEQVIVEQVPHDWNFFTSSFFGFSLRYPSTYTPDTSYTYPYASGITGLALTIPESMSEGTNLSRDTRISVEGAEGECTAKLFLPNAGPAREVIENGVTYQVASTGEGAAGNRYEETVYVLDGTGRCIAVRYYIHSTVLENYEPGTAEAFDRDRLLREFDMIRRTLTLTEA